MKYLITISLFLSVISCQYSRLFTKAISFLPTQEKVAQEKATQERIVSQRKAAQEKVAQEKATQERIVSQRKAAQEKVAQEKATQERIVSQRKAAQEKVAQEKATQERIVSQRKAATARTEAKAAVVPIKKAPTSPTLTSEQRQHLFNLKKRTLAIKGFDPVSYFSGKPVKGKKANSYTHAGVTYYFASPNNLNQFKLTPQKYTPAFGGWCAYAMIKGQKVDINPKTFKIVDGKLYLFYKGLLGNTKTMWEKIITSKAPEKQIIAKAFAHWDKHLKVTSK